MKKPLLPTRADSIKWCVHKMFLFYVDKGTKNL